MGRLAPENLLPGERHDIELRPIEFLGEGRRCRVADRQSLSVAGDPIAVGHANAGGGAIPGENDVVVEIDLGKVRQLAVRRLERADVLELELLDDVGHPAFAKAFPGKNVDASRAKKRPERHLDGAGVGAWRDPDAIVGRNAEHFAGEVDRELELGFADLCAMRTAERRVTQNCRGPAGALGAWAGREAGVCGPNARRVGRHDEPSFQMEASRWGEVSRCGSYRNRRSRASGVAKSFRTCGQKRPTSSQGHARFKTSHPTFVSLTSALALASPSGLANLNPLALSPGALRSRLRSVRVFAPALIPHAGEEQDLSGAAVARNHATGTVRGPERDDIVQ